MMELVAVVGADKENWGQIAALMNRMECERVILVQPAGVSAFSASEKCILIEVNSNAPISFLKQEIADALRPLLSSSFEVAVSLASGTGKEHMALIAALLSIPVGVRLAVYTKDGVQFLT